MANPPIYQSMLSVPTQLNDFIALQSAQLAVTTASASVTFSTLPGTARRKFRITNSGTTGCYLASGSGSATAVVATATPSPSAPNGAVSNCDYIGPGASRLQDFIYATDTIAAICASGTTTLEISVGS